MSLEIVLPVAREPAVQVQHTRHTWKALPTRPVLGLIDNGKTRARDLLVGVAKLLETRGIIDSHFVLRKPTAGHTITTENRAELLARAHMIVSGIGD